MALHIPTGPLKSRSGLEPVSRYEPSTYLATAPSLPVPEYSSDKADSITVC